MGSFGLFVFSHEIKTPSSSIYADLVLDSKQSKFGPPTL